MVADAKQKADTILSDANGQADAQLRQAQEKATSLQQDAERKHTEIMTTVKKQQAALEARLEELRTYEREYRTRLKTFLESQLDELNSRSTAAPSSSNIDGNNN